jgi:hypothetical protein
MASKVNYSTTLRNARLDAITTAVGSAGVLEIRDGSQPAGPGSAATGTLGASFTLGSPFAPAAAAGVLSPTLPSDVNGSASITPTWARIKTSGGTAVIDCSVGTSGCDINLTGSIANGQNVHISSWTITEGDSGH